MIIILLGLVEKKINLFINYLKRYNFIKLTINEYDYKSQLLNNIKDERIENYILLNCKKEQKDWINLRFKPCYFILINNEDNYNEFNKEDFDFILDNDLNENNIEKLYLNLEKDSIEKIKKINRFLKSWIKNN